MRQGVFILQGAKKAPSLFNDNVNVGKRDCYAEIKNFTIKKASDNTCQRLKAKTKAAYFQTYFEKWLLQTNSLLFLVLASKKVIGEPSWQLSADI